MKRNILTLTLAIALVFVTFKAFAPRHNDADSKDASAPAEAVFNNIMTRTSIRKYQDKPVEKDKVEKLLKAGMAAPSAVDARPWHFIVVDDKAVLQQLAAVSPTNKPVSEAPLAIVVCGDMDLALEGDGQDYWIQDCSAVSQNILLEAHALGLGAVWTSTYPAPGRLEHTRKVLKMPTELKALNIIAIGYPAESPQPKDKWDETAVSYNEYGGNASN